MAALGLVGLLTVGGQLLTPLAGDLATDADRGAVVGTVVSGILTGILLSRTVSGFVADAFGWRSIYAGAAVLDVVLAVLLWRAIPDLEPKARVRYPALIGSVFTVIRRERVVRWTLVLAGIGFALFTMFWTALTFLLSGAPFNYPVSVIGLFGLVGLVGAVAAQRAGRLHDARLVGPRVRHRLGAGRRRVRGRRGRRPFGRAGRRRDPAARRRHPGDQHPQPDADVRRVGARPAAGSTRPSSPTTSSGAPAARSWRPSCGVRAAGRP